MIDDFSETSRCFLYWLVSHFHFMPKAKSPHKGVSISFLKTLKGRTTEDIYTHHKLRQGCKIVSEQFFNSVWSLPGDITEPSHRSFDLQRSAKRKII